MLHNPGQVRDCSMDGRAVFDLPAGTKNFPFATITVYKRPAYCNRPSDYAMGCAVRGSNTGKLKGVISSSKGLDPFRAHPAPYWKGIEGYQGLNSQDLNLTVHFWAYEWVGVKFCPP
jgi:hypothetical protein